VFYVDGTLTTLRELEEDDRERIDAADIRRGIASDTASI